MFKKSRLRKILAFNEMDIENRDKAILYINGKVYAGYTHQQCVKKYFTEIGADTKHINDFVFDQEIADNEQIAFGHLLNDNSTIYLDADNLFDVSYETAKQAIIDNFPDYTVEPLN